MDFAEYKSALTSRGEVCSAFGSGGVVFGIQNQVLLPISLPAYRQQLDWQMTLHLPLPILLVTLVTLSERPKTVFLTKLAAP
jgi:hypothetical protein